MQSLLEDCKAIILTLTQHKQALADDNARKDQIILHMLQEKTQMQAQMQAQKQARKQAVIPNPNIQLVQTPKTRLVCTPNKDETLTMGKENYVGKIRDYSKERSTGRKKLPQTVKKVRAFELTPEEDKRGVRLGNIQKMLRQLTDLAQDSDEEDSSPSVLRSVWA